MKFSNILHGTALLGLSISAQANPIEEWIDGFRISFQSLYKTDVSFGMTSSAAMSDPGALVHEVDRFYNDGFVRTLDGGNVGGQLTGFWDYNNASQINGNFLEMTSLQGDAGFDFAREIDEIPGIELQARHLFREKDKRKIGIETGVGFLSKRQSQTDGFNMTRTVDSYDVSALIAAGQMPAPNRSALDVSQGGVDNNTTNFLINDLPSRSTENLNGSGSRDFDVTLWNLRIGAFIEQILNPKFRVGLHGGLLLTIADAEFNYSESYNGVSFDGSVEDTSALWGGYIGISANYQLTEDLTLFGQYSYQSVEDFEIGTTDRVAGLDLSEAYLLQLGVGFLY